MTNKFPMRNKFLPSTSSPNDEINIVQVQVLAPLLVHVRCGTYKNNVMTMAHKSSST